MIFFSDFLHNDKLIAKFQISKKFESPALTEKVGWLLFVLFAELGEMGAIAGMA